MNKIKNSLIIAAYVLLVSAFFFGGCAFGSRMAYKKTASVVLEPSALPAAVPASAVKENEKKESVKYIVIIQNGRLCIFKEEGTFRTLISSEKISENIYPAADIAELKKGIEFETKEKAQELFENFVS